MAIVIGFVMSTLPLSYFDFDASAGALGEFFAFDWQQLNPVAHQHDYTLYSNVTVH